MPEQYVLSPAQGVQLMALSEMLRDGELAFRGDDSSDETRAYELLIDVGQEIALQIGGGS